MNNRGGCHDNTSVIMAATNTSSITDLRQTNFTIIVRHYYSQILRQDYEQMECDILGLYAEQNQIS